MHVSIHKLKLTWIDLLLIKESDGGDWGSMFIASLWRHQEEGQSLTGTAMASTSDGMFSTLDMSTLTEVVHRYASKRR